MKFITNLKIEIQRWRYRRKIKIAKEKDADKMAKAIIKANFQTQRSRKRLWVIKLDYADYVICTKQQVRAYLRKIGLMVNYMQTNEYIIHITKKPE